MPEKILEEVWESIVKVNAKENNNSLFDYYFTTAQSHTYLVNEYHLIKACLLKLMFRVDKAVIQLLKDRGYKISLESQDAYVRSIDAAQSRSNNLITKLMTKQKELERMSRENQSLDKVTFPKAIAGISAGIGFAVGEDVSLATYNEYKKIIHTKNGRNRQAGFNK